MKGLILSGGGVFGAFQLGVLQQIISEDPFTEYDFIAGISIGAVNGAKLAQPGSIPNNLAELTRIWKKIESDSDVFLHRAFGILSTLFRKGLYRVDPIKNLIDSNYQGVADHREFLVGYVDLLTANYLEETGDGDHIKDHILSSSIIPIFFTPVEVDGKICVDGGIVKSAPLKAAIEAGCNDIDIILTFPRKNRLNQLCSHDLKNTLDVANRSLDIMLDRITMSEIKLFHAYNQLSLCGVGAYKYINARIFCPEAPLAAKNNTVQRKSIEFSQENIEMYRQIGRRTNAITVGEFLKKD